MFSHLREDIQSVFDRDPAARTFWEVLTCYPGVHAMVSHRLAHWLWIHGLRCWVASYRTWDASSPALKSTLGQPLGAVCSSITGWVS